MSDTNDDEEQWYHAEKMPHSMGRKEGLFKTCENAKTYIELAIQDEPDVEDARWREHSFSEGRWVYSVVEGKGRVAGVVTPVTPRFEDEDV